jgi:CDP-glycerol glycerophosphotransferase
VSYTPARIIGALRRRKNDLIRSALYRPASGTGATLRNAVLFEAFDGKVVGDSPLDIFNALKQARPDLEFFWTVKKGVAAPAGATALKYGSREWLNILATAKYLVNNSAFPWYFKKIEGQVYLQTWHGTPLKRLVRDIEAGKVSTQYLSTMRKESAAWDYLISPSAYATACFKSAFDFPIKNGTAKSSGRVLEVGYPRNDRLNASADERVATRNRVRKQLGVKSEQTQLVLYAPTWRDTNRNAVGTLQTVNYIDVSTKLPKGFQLMYRGHSMTLDAHNSKTANGAIDVTNYPDITELFLAADVLITDYSSVMFDFAVTGKPMIFLAPDIQKYVADRGFYFDFVAEAPGPICDSTAEVMASLESIKEAPSEFGKQYAKRYKAWQAKFNPLEDGQATARVIAVVFGSK